MSMSQTPSAASNLAGCEDGIPEPLLQRTHIEDEVDDDDGTTLSHVNAIQRQKYDVLWRNPNNGIEQGKLYDRVAVLLVSWGSESSEGDSSINEIRTLQETFSSCFNYKTPLFGQEPFPFCFDDKTPLSIVYYAGHGNPSPDICNKQSSMLLGPDAIKSQANRRIWDRHAGDIITKPRRNSGLLGCPFNFLCNQKPFSDVRDWISHSLAHFTSNDHRIKTQSSRITSRLPLLWASLLFANGVNASDHTAIPPNMIDRGIPRKFGSVDCPQAIHSTQTVLRTLWGLQNTPSETDSSSIVLGTFFCVSAVALLAQAGRKHPYQPHIVFACATLSTLPGTLLQTDIQTLLFFYTFWGCVAGLAISQVAHRCAALQGQKDSQRCFDRKRGGLEIKG